MRCCHLFLSAVLALLAVPNLAGQSQNGTISGLVTDPTGAVIAGADVLVANDATGLKYEEKTNATGFYLVPNIPPGTYRLQIAKIGFKTVIKPGIVLNVQDSLAINFTLSVGAASEVVTVTSGAPLVNTTDGSLGTVVDQHYVANMPLNGRSFQDLIMLTPGVSTNTPQRTGAVGDSGEFSVDGQRTESNYYTVDGVSADIGIFPGSVGPGNAGAVAASTAQGTTQSLVSVDALQEFRVQSSTYSAEYGRSPGGQFAFLTRSGTNQWHGTAFDYLRNDVFDANDWFNDYYGQPKGRERQNDFGGTLGGPVQIPGVYNGKDRTFFFLSYEGLRLDQPQASSVSYVPDAVLRSSAPAPLQQVLNAFPTANGTDLGNGLAEFIGTWSNPSRIDSYSVRFDHSPNQHIRTFFRFSATPSDIAVRGMALESISPASVVSSSDVVHTYTFGLDSVISHRATNEFRLNYSSNTAEQAYGVTNFAGGQSVDLAALQGLSLTANPIYYEDVLLTFPGYEAVIAQGKALGKQRQWNLLDDVTLSASRHEMKFGVDYRRLAPVQENWNPELDYFYDSAASVESNSIDNAQVAVNAPAYPLYVNLSAFAQDTWKVLPRLTFSIGLRWEVNPAPGSARGIEPYTVRGSNLGTLSLAPQGTPLWQTTWFNLAPRFGVAYVLQERPGWMTVFRGGAGVYFDTGQQAGSEGYSGPGFFAYQLYGTLNGTTAAFPLSADQINVPIVNPPLPPYSTVYAFPSHLQLPYTLQTSATLQQELGSSQVITVSYAGAFARRLLEGNLLNAGSTNQDFTYVLEFENGLTSDYNALQFQFQRRLSSGLEALASYTWAHSIDYGSYDVSYPYQRGNSDYDLRHNFSGAFSYDLPSWANKVADITLNGWGVDGRFTARSGFPVTLNGPGFFDTATQQFRHAGLNLVSGQPIYLYGGQCTAAYANGRACPGGRAINPNAFSVPAGCSPFFCPPGVGTGTAPRNFVRGFSMWEADAAVRRDFPMTESWKLQFRAEAFNLFNHPNFGSINALYCAPGIGCTFGQANATLAQSLGVVSPLYQTGGPRSIQFALKLVF